MRLPDLCYSSSLLHSCSSSAALWAAAAFVAYWKKGWSPTGKAEQNINEQTDIHKYVKVASLKWISTSFWWTCWVSITVSHCLESSYKTVVPVSGFKWQLLQSRFTLKYPLTKRDQWETPNSKLWSKACWEWGQILAALALKYLTGVSWTKTSKLSMFIHFRRP